MGMQVIHIRRTTLQLQPCTSSTAERGGAHSKYNRCHNIQCKCPPPLALEPIPGIDGNTQAAMQAPSSVPEQLRSTLVLLCGLPARNPGNCSRAELPRTGTQEMPWLPSQNHQGCKSQLKPLFSAVGRHVLERGKENPIPATSSCPNTARVRGLTMELADFTRAFPLYYYNSHNLN